MERVVVVEGRVKGPFILNRVTSVLVLYVAGNFEVETVFIYTDQCLCLQISVYVYRPVFTYKTSVYVYRSAFMYKTSVYVYRSAFMYKISVYVYRSVFMYTNQRLCIRPVFMCIDQRLCIRPVFMCTDQCFPKCPSVCHVSQTLRWTSD